MKPARVDRQPGDEDMAALIAGLHAIGQKLEDLTAGEIDAVADQLGRPFVLRRSQEHGRQQEASRQAAILNALPAHIAVLDSQGVIVSVNDAWRRFADANALHGPRDGLGSDYLRVCDRAWGAHSDEAAQVATGIRAVLQEGLARFSIEYPCHSPTEQRWFLMTVTPLDEARAIGAVVMHLNISERKRSEEELRRFAAAMDATSDAIFLTDRASMRFVHVNDAACRLRELTREQLLALRPWQMLDIPREVLEHSYDRLIAGDADAPGAEVLETHHRRDDGSHRWVELRREAHRSGADWTIVTLVRDISARKQAEQRVSYLAYYDVLTGLANRNLFLDRVNQHLCAAASGGHRLALFLVDLERFKNINDSLGQSAGDALLRQVGHWLSSKAGDASLFARIGADHFAAVLPEVTAHGSVARLLEKTMAAFLEHPFRLNDAVFRIALKVGVALFPEDGSDAETLFKNAETALKKAKASGDRYLFYRQAMTATVAGQLTLENQLRLALEREEFVLHYQPKVTLDGDRLGSAEALIRWNDPRTGLVPPSRFIPVLEETGLIFEVGRWALQQAVADYRRWRLAGLSAVRIAVNVSPLQLRHRGFIAEIEQVIGHDAQAAEGLELEITESLIMEDVRHSIASLQAIRAMGLTVAIDDFGTGFSSLSYLSRLPVDALKIDQSFVSEMNSSPQGLALVSTIIGLAQALQLKVVAEGVETQEQARQLRQLRCDEMQGYLFSRPLACELFEARYLRHC